jgi:hypothetical protein
MSLEHIQMPISVAPYGFSSPTTGDNASVRPAHYGPRRVRKRQHWVWQRDLRERQAPAGYPQ